MPQPPHGNSSEPAGPLQRTVRRARGQRARKTDAFHARSNGGRPARQQSVKIAVDLTQLVPGGENGGAKVMTLALLRAMSRLEPRWRFTLLMRASVWDELRPFAAENVSLMVVGRREQNSFPGVQRSGHVPSAWRQRARSARWLALPRAGHTWLLRRPRALPDWRQLAADAYFAPLAPPRFYHPRAPLVAVVHDLQHVDCRRFFATAERLARDMNLRMTRRRASLVICVSEFTRRRVVEHTGIERNRTCTIPIGFDPPSETDTDRDAEELLRAYGLARQAYLFFPANTWPHKNHLRLYQALAKYAAAAPQSKLQLVCTGADAGRRAELERAADSLGLTERVRQLGFVGPSDLQVLLRYSKALIFPSLYEGFGMPVLEAMHARVPVLCSHTTSLPEVAGDAALFLDPHAVDSIARAIARIDSEPDLAGQLIAAGQRRAAEHSTLDEMAAAYLDALSGVAATPTA